jgi:methionyl-tRNA formyltransferase
VLPSAVENCAGAYQIPILKPLHLKDPTFLATLDSYQADLYVVVAFRKLPKVVWHKPKLGTINLHASLLPYYRGAAPIQWALIQGEKVTGVTIFLIEEEIDTGQILLQEQAPIYQADTADTLAIRLQYQGARLLLRSVAMLAAHPTYSPIPQPTLPGAILPKAPKIYTPACQINWQQPTTAVYNFIRGLAPLPGAWTVWDGLPTKIKEAYPIPAPIATPGTLFSDGKTYLYVATADGMLAVDRVQPAGKKEMSIQQFLQGNRWNSYML